MGEVGVEPVPKFDALAGRGMGALQVDVPALGLAGDRIGDGFIAGLIAALFKHTDHGPFDSRNADFQQRSDVGIRKSIKTAEQEDLLSAAGQFLNAAAKLVTFRAERDVGLPRGQAEQ